MLKEGKRMAQSAKREKQWAELAVLNNEDRVLSEESYQPSVSFQLSANCKDNKRYLTADLRRWTPIYTEGNALSAWRKA